MLESVLSLASRPAYSSATRHTSPDDLGTLFQSKHIILRQKLEVWALMLNERLTLHSSQLERIASDRLKAAALAESVARQANYLLRPRSDTNDFHKLLFQLETEQRDKEVQCWENVFDVLKEFLLAWEAYEQGKARSQLLAVDV